MSVEAFNVAQDNVDDRRSGFFTCKWVIGFICSLIAGILHVGRCFRHTFFSLIYIVITVLYSGHAIRRHCGSIIQLGDRDPDSSLHGHLLSKRGLHLQV